MWSKWVVVTKAKEVKQVRRAHQRKDRRNSLPKPKVTNKWTVVTGQNRSEAKCSARNSRVR
eukprot:CAMPEP_0185748112 /NCGR_PEP_ID=MMETSP1174-20130828/6767_1 /TAXON_ID=35687 /ORGANISM="Dictyocha speculum, Strain CCMP1381" /LENGTH=60 /DNA_ID=CAMNT_0028423613 /DNA_START=91 /DNA_END=273 /DNA_ORIENTATION=+